MFPCTHRTGGWVGLRVVWTQRLQEKFLASAGNGTPVGLSAVRDYNDWDTAASTSQQDGTIKYLQKQLQAIASAQTRRCCHAVFRKIIATYTVRMLLAIIKLGWWFWSSNYKGNAVCRVVFYAGRTIMTFWRHVLDLSKKIWKALISPQSLHSLNQVKLFINRWHCTKLSNSTQSGPVIVPT
jgi:hypothetical protein